MYARKEEDVSSTNIIADGKVFYIFAPTCHGLHIKTLVKLVTTFILIMSTFDAVWIFSYLNFKVSESLKHIFGAPNNFK